MKNGLIIFLWLCFLQMHGQLNVSFGYTNNVTRSNVILALSTDVGKGHEIGAGLRYFIADTRTSPDLENYIFYKRQSPINVAQRFGANLFYHYYFYRKKDWLYLFVFYDLQMSYAPTFTDLKYYQGITTVNGEASSSQYTSEKFRFGPFLWLENNIGIGLRVNIAKGFYLSQKAGIGAVFLAGKDDRLVPYVRKYPFIVDFSYMYHIALGYRIQWKKKA